MIKFRDLSPLAKIISVELHRVKQSWGYDDTAQQIADALEAKMPEECDYITMKTDLTKQLASMRMERDAAVRQLQARIARAQNKNFWAHD